MPSRKIWAMWAIASIFYAYQYILRVMPNITMHDIMSKYHIDPSVFGQFSGIYYIGYSLIHLPLGLLLDRFGPKKIMPLFMMLTVIGMSPLIFTDIWFYPIIGRMLIGIGSSSAILGVFKIIRMTFAEEKFTWMLSLSVTIGLLGGIYGGVPVHFLRESFGFEQVVMFLMAGGAILSFIAYLILPPYEPQQKSSSVVKDLKVVFSNKKVIAICILAGLMVGPLEGFADVWGTTFLKTVYGLDEAIAAGLPSMIYFGMCIGGPALSLLAERTSPLFVILSCATVMGLVFAAFLMTTPSVTLLTALLFLVGMLCAYQILAIAHASTYVAPEAAGLTSAVANMIIMTFGYFFHAVIGKVVGLFGGTDISITADALIYGVSVIPMALAIGALGFGYLLVMQRSKLAS